MRTERPAALALGLMMLVVSGCEEPPPQHQSHWFPEGGPASEWKVKTTVDSSGRVREVPKTRPKKESKPVRYKPDTEIVSPILNARGNWTVRVAFYHPNPEKRLSALHYANNHARALIKQGYEAYITDILSLTIVSIGSYNDKRDPKLLETWREAYDAWLKLHGGQKSGFRRHMEEFYGNRTVFGDQPWPVSIIDLQVKMKGAYNIPITEEDKRRHREYMRKGKR